MDDYRSSFARTSTLGGLTTGMNGSDPSHREKMINIYFESLSLNAVAQATLKYQFIKAGKLAGSKIASKSLVLTVIMKIGKAFGNRISSKKAGRLAPVVGGVAGAAANYSLACKTSKSMKKAFKKAYFETWQ